MKQPQIPLICSQYPAGDWVAGEVQLAFGGVAAKTITAPKTEALLVGKPWTEANLTAALVTLAEDVWISPNAPGEMWELLLFKTKVRLKRAYLFS